MYWTCILAFVIFTSIITCENANLTNVKWEYYVDTAEPLKTVLENKSSILFINIFLDLI